MKKKIKTLIILMFVVLLSPKIFAETSWFNDFDSNDNTQEKIMSDVEISLKIKEMLSHVQGINSNSLSIKTEFGHVTILGFVKNKEQENEIANLVKNMEGVKDVDTMVNIKQK